MAFDLDVLLDDSAPRLSEVDVAEHLSEAGRIYAWRRSAEATRAASGGGRRSSDDCAARGRWSRCGCNRRDCPVGRSPPGSITYTLRSGRTCEQRVGNFEAGEPAAQAMLREWLSSRPLSEVLDGNAAIEDLRSSPNMWAGGEIGAGISTTTRTTSTKLLSGMP